jgi:hypothetical protein
MYPNLFSRLRVGGTVFKNRVTMAPIRFESPAGVPRSNEIEHPLGAVE